MTNFNVRLLKDYHPDGFQDEWLDKGALVQACVMPNGIVYLGFGEVGKTSLGGCFMTNAKQGVDYEVYSQENLSS